MTDKQTPTDAATPECLTCSDHGAVGNILTAEPCPDCTHLNAQPAPATQPAGAEPPGIQALMCVISSLRDMAHFSDEEGCELMSALCALRDWAHAQPAAEASRFGSPELQAMIIARCVEKDQADSGFDYKTAADFLSGKTVSDEALRKFVAASRDAHDARAALHAKMLSLQGELASREAEIALLKRSLLDAEADAAAPKPPTAQADSVQEDAALWHWLAEYLVGTRTDLDDEIIASATVDELRKLVDADLAARKQGEKQ